MPRTLPLPEPRPPQVEPQRHVLLFLGAVALGLAVLVFLLRDLLGVFVISLFASFLIIPLVDRLERRGVGRGAGTLLVFAAVIALIGGGLTYLVPALVQEFHALALTGQAYFVTLNQQLAAHPSVSLFDIQLNIRDAVGSFLGASAGSSADVLQQRALAVLVGPLGLSLVGFTLAALGTLFQLLLVLIVTFFLVRDVERISNLLRNLVPATYRDDVSDLAHRLRIMFAAYLRGQGLICLIIGAATGVVIFVLRLDYALALAVIAGLSAIVPFIGPFIGAVPAVAFALAVSPVKALIVAVAFVVIDNVVLNFVVPKVMGDAVRLHPVIVIVAFLAGYSAAGLVGMFVAIPVAATARIMFDFFRERVYGRAPVTP